MREKQVPVDVVEMKGKFIGALRAECPWVGLTVAVGPGVNAWLGRDARTGCGSDLRAWGSATERGCKVRSFVLSNFTRNLSSGQGKLPRFSPHGACSPSTGVGFLAEDVGRRVSSCVRLRHS